MGDDLRQLSDYTWEIPLSYREGMRVPGLIFADRELITLAQGDRALEQVANVACLPGIVERSLAMPDIHWGYGFPIGGVAAFGKDEGVVSPGGVGFDISCGVRLVRTDLEKKEIEGRIRGLLLEMERHIPKGLGVKGPIKTVDAELKRVFSLGAERVIEMGYGWAQDLEHTEEGGRYPGADPSKVSPRALERGRQQLGTLGSGNHFVEVQVVEEIYDEVTASAFGLSVGQITVMVHSGSRGAGHQICTDYLKIMDHAARSAGIELPDRQLACAPLESPEARDYMAALACAGNYAIANRQCLMHWVRVSFEKFFKVPAERLGMSLVYDISHNIAKMESHEVEGELRELCVHRKGATAAFPAGHPGLPPDYADIGQPVIIPGDMGTHSFVLVGVKESEELSFSSTCHGAGRTMSRSKAKKTIRGEELKRRLEDRGIIVMAGKPSLLAEEAPEAYKDVTRIVDVCEKAGLSRKVAMLTPLGVLKG